LQINYYLCSYFVFGRMFGTFRIKGRTARVPAIQKFILDF
jgi:hypothetical protein